MNKTCLALAAAMVITSCSGCCFCRRLFTPRPAVVQPAPLCAPAPAPSCCPSSPCGGCDSCGVSSGYGGSELNYAPMDSPQVIYGNNMLPPGPQG